MAGDAIVFEQRPSAPAGGAELSAPPPMVRDPLGIPAGSVRAVLILMVLGMVWTLLLMPPEKHVTVPLYLYYLLFLTVGAYFASRAKAPPGGARHEAHPLHLPRGSVRLLIILGCGGVVGYALYQNPDLLDTAVLQTDEKPTLLLPLVLLGAFLLGVVSSSMGQWIFAGPAGMSVWLQDLQAWVSLMAVLGLGAQVILELVIFPSMDPAQRPHLPHLQLFLSAVIAFYFGARV